MVSGVYNRTVLSGSSEVQAKFNCQTTLRDVGDGDICRRGEILASCLKVYIAFSHFSLQVLMNLALGNDEVRFLEVSCKRFMNVGKDRTRQTPSGYAIISHLLD